MLDVLEQYENKDVKETISRGGTRKKGGNDLIDNFKNILKVNDKFSDNKQENPKNTDVLGGKRK
jgi:hypothetical protein